jgi:hypothetical protein
MVFAVPFRLEQLRTLARRLAGREADRQLDDDVQLSHVEERNEQMRRDLGRQRDKQSD